MAYQVKIELIEKEKIVKNRTIYRAPCRVANWFEDQAFAEQKTLFSRYKADRCSLLVQKTIKMCRNLLKPVQLAHDTEFLRYGNNYLIRALDVPNLLTPENRARGDILGLYLSGVITDKEIDTIQEFTHGCKMSASISKQACARNTFRLVGCEYDACGEPVLYGVDFYIQIVESGNVPLYVRSDNTSMSTIGVERELYLSQIPDRQCRFKLMSWNPDLRSENKGSLIRPGARVVIQHSASGQNLAVQFNSLFQTFFGVECTVVCRTYKDTHKMEKVENFWSLLGGEPLNKFMVVKAARGQNVSDYYLE